MVGAKKVSIKELEKYGSDLLKITDDDKELGYKHKVGRAGEQEGKDLTVYIGSRDEAQAAADRISQELGDLLGQPYGTTLTDVTSTFTPSLGSNFDILIDSDGSGNVTLYVNGSSVATTSAGPTGSSTGIVPTVWVETVATASVGAGSSSAFHATNMTLDLGTA